MYIIGGGPSARGLDLSRLRERGFVLGVNRAAELLPCDAFFTIDVHLMEHYRERIPAWCSAGVEAWLAVPEDYQRPPIPGSRYVVRQRGEGFSSDPRAVINGLNSGYSAINLAVLRGARRIVLVGYDMDGEAERSHWHDGYPWYRSRHPSRCYPDWARRFDALARELPEGVEVVNANPESAITAFPRTGYEVEGLHRKA